MVLLRAHERCLPDARLYEERPFLLPRAANHARWAAQRHPPDAAQGQARSEEHKSEHQSLMRISYAVFCLKKKRKHYNNYSLAVITSHSNTYNNLMIESSMNVRLR